MGIFPVWKYAQQPALTSDTVRAIRRGAIFACAVVGCVAPQELGITCITCGITACWYCLGWQRVALCSVRYCVKCAREDHPEDPECVIPGRELLDATWQEAAASHLSQSHDLKRRFKTSDGYFRMVRAVRAWAAHVCGRLICPPAPSPSLLVHYVLTRLDYVDFQTISNELTAISEWCKIWIAYFGGTNPCEFPTVQDAKALSKDSGFVANKKKKPFKSSWIRAFIEAHIIGTGTGTWVSSRVHREYALAILIVCATFLRRKAASVIPFGGTDSLGAGGETPVSDAASDGVQYIRLRASDTKNTRLRAFTYRYLTDVDATGMPWRTWFLNLVTDKVAGPLLSKADGSPFDARSWTDCFDYFTAFVREFDQSCLRVDVGATSGRRWFAQTLYQQGNLRKDQLRALGFWMSDACDIYLDEDVDGRISLLRGFAQTMPLRQQTPVTEAQAEERRSAPVSADARKRARLAAADVVAAAGSRPLTALGFLPLPALAIEDGAA